MRGLFRDPAFDPARESRIVRMVASDANTILLMPPLMARLAEQAPAMQVVVEGYGPDLIARMKKGELDFVFALASSPLPPGTESLALGQDRMVLVTRRGHPLAGKRPTPQDHARFPHVAVSIFGDGQSEMNTVLAARGLSRHVGLTTPHFMAALTTVATTDHVATLSEALARRFAPALGLVLTPSPLFPEPLTMTLVWDHVRSSDPALAWFRQMLREIAAGIYLAK